MVTEVNEAKFYPLIVNWLRKFIGCHYAKERKTLWGRQPDVLGVKFEKLNRENELRLDLYLVEAKIIDCLDSAYNLIGEMESRIALFKKESSAFYALHPYLAIYKSCNCKEIQNYANHRGIGLIRLKNYKNPSLSLVRSPSLISSNKILSIGNLKDESWINARDEAKIFREAVKTGWWRLKELISR